MTPSALLAVIAVLGAGTAFGAGRDGRSHPGWATTLAPLAIELARSEDAADAEDADNTGRNVRDREEGSVTPLDQGSSEADRDITARIRREIVANDALSTNAQNAKIVTRDGVVTLRGPVKTPEERDAIAAVAQRTPGVKRVDNQLEVERDR